MLISCSRAQPATSAATLKIAASVTLRLIAWICGKLGQLKPSIRCNFEPHDPMCGRRPGIAAVPATLVLALNSVSPATVPPSTATRSRAPGSIRAESAVRDQMFFRCGQTEGRVPGISGRCSSIVGNRVGNQHPPPMKNPVITGMYGAIVWRAPLRTPKANGQKGTIPALQK